MEPKWVKIPSRTEDILKIAESSKTLSFRLFFNDLHGLDLEKPIQIGKKSEKKQT